MKPSTCSQEFSNIISYIAKTFNQNTANTVRRGAFEYANIQYPAANIQFAPAIIG
jgi:hypothetical protein